jgi:hypothetical protein
MEELHVGRLPGLFGGVYDNLFELNTAVGGPPTLKAGCTKAWLPASLLARGPSTMQQLE